MGFEDSSDFAIPDRRDWLRRFFQLLELAQLVRISDYTNQKGIPGKTAVFKICVPSGVQYLFVTRHFTISPISGDFIRCELNRYGLHARQTKAIRPYLSNGGRGTFTEIEIDRTGLRNWYILGLSAVLPYGRALSGFDFLARDPRW